ncbi:MAG: hypothetical protein NTZ10_00380 [Candidatus Saganbacteria bacterium]|nr:hypothetical protein [Candidatus Saganbacteria bacterium]
MGATVPPANDVIEFSKNIVYYYKALKVRKRSAKPPSGVIDGGNARPPKANEEKIMDKEEEKIFEKMAQGFMQKGAITPIESNTKHIHLYLTRVDKQGYEHESFGVKVPSNMFTKYSKNTD